MPAQDDVANFQTLLDNAERAVDLVDGRDFAEFDDDPELRFAVQYSIGNVG